MKLTFIALVAPVAFSVALNAGEAAVQEWVAASPAFLQSWYPQRNFVKTELKVGDSTLDIYVQGEATPELRACIMKWIRTGARAVSSYFGNFPVKRVTIVLPVNAGKTIRSGVTYGGRTIRLEVGRQAAQECFDNDWRLTHEMFHLGFPDLKPEHLWMNEGEAVYFEPIARVRIADITVDDLWKGMIEGLPNGLPEAGEKGLDHTQTWGRTYWGGTLFWFLCDIEIRKQTHNKHSADDAMRGVLKAGGDGSKLWPMSDVLEALDRATETHVFSEMYKKWADAPVEVDLPALWRSLGVEKRADGSMRYDDAAPLAEVRKAITDPKQNP